MNTHTLHTFPLANLLAARSLADMAASMHYARGTAANAASRGADSAIDCSGDAVVLSKVVDNDTLPFVNIAGVGDKCLPAHIVEGVYARVLRPGDDVLGHTFGGFSVSVAKFVTLEQHLARLHQDKVFSFEVCSVTEFVRRITDLPHSTAFDLSAADMVANVAHGGARNENEIWVDEIEVNDLLDSTSRLAPFADLALLCGERCATTARRMVAGAAASRYVTVFTLLAPVAREFDALGPEVIPAANAAALLPKPPSFRTPPA